MRCPKKRQGGTRRRGSDPRTTVAKSTRARGPRGSKEKSCVCAKPGKRVGSTSGKQAGPAASDRCASTTGEGSAKLKKKKRIMRPEGCCAKKTNKSRRGKHGKGLRGTGEETTCRKYGAGCGARGKGLENQSANGPSNGQGLQRLKKGSAELAAKVDSASPRVEGVA